MSKQLKFFQDFVKWRKAILTTIIGVFVVIQFVPVDRSSSPITADIDTPSDVKAILKRSCYDCHSNETLWPWYSKVAPISWLISYDVHEGREELNFSTWGNLSTKKQVELLEEIWEEVEGEEMPLWYYLPAHSEARIRPADRQILKNWIKLETSSEENPN